jgi:hypothetical protein
MTADRRVLHPQKGRGEVRLAWLCFDDAPGAERRRKRNGILIDGVLPDPYGIEPEELAEIMGDYSRRTAGSSAP